MIGLRRGSASLAADVTACSGNRDGIANGAGLSLGLRRCLQESARDGAQK